MNWAYGFVALNLVCVLIEFQLVNLRNHQNTLKFKPELEAIRAVEAEAYSESSALVDRVGDQMQAINRLDIEKNNAEKFYNDVLEVTREVTADFG